MNNSPLLLAIVGMPGAGKSEATTYITQKGLPCVRFGQVTDEGLQEKSMPLTPENEQKFREQLRKELGMAAYAMRVKPSIDALLREKSIVVLDGLYSWEEYLYLRQFFTVTLIHIFAERKTRYERLAHRSVRPLSQKEAEERDIAELEKLNKGGPIAMADYLINNNDDIVGMQKQIDTLLARLGVVAKQA